MLARFPRSAVIAAALLALAPAAARAQSAPQDSPEGVRALEAQLKKVAAEATPKTVCVKSYIDDSSDKAGYGSGAILSEDGYVLTCAHVVDIAKRCEIFLSDGTSYPAKLLGKCRKQDYALCKIEAKGLKFFEIGDSSKLKVGDFVMALGHPGGPYEDLRPSFAAGRVTGLHRKLPVQMMDRFYDDGIQTDVPIVFGNSGGPLVDLSGKLVGLNGAIIMINDNAFAVPINEAMADIEAMKRGDMIAGKDASEKDIADFQKQMDPEMMQKMFSRGLKNFGKLFGAKGGENPFGKLFGGENGENPLAKLFGEGGGNDFGKLFGKLLNPKGDEDGEKDPDQEGADPGQGLDLGKLMKGFQKMMEGQGKDGENPFGKLFGGEGGEGPDFQKLMKGFQKMFGQQEPDEGDDDEKPAPRTRERPMPGETPRLAPAVDRGGWLGVKADMTAAPDAGGVVVGEVLKDSPAAKAGLKKGDVIVSLGSRLTSDIQALKAAVGAQAPGSETTMMVDRTRVLDATLVRERVEVKVTIAAREGAK